MNTSDGIRSLEPQAVWNNFADLNAVPRASKKESRVIEFMRRFGEGLGLKTTVDAIGNVVIYKPATKGMENRPTVVLQSHLDMVHQKNAGTQFDFDSEGIRSLIDGEWVKADGTTLGADNGIGVASAMALLQSKDIAHPALEALFTIDEETGMTGAKGLDETLLHGKILLNLDSEEDDELTIGCAGGIDTNTRMSYAEEPPVAGGQAYKIHILGLKGGHSGLDIHLGRGNANKLMTRLLYRSTQTLGLRIASMDGGSLRNAIPREALAVVVVPAAGKKAFLDEFNKRKADILKEYHTIEPDMAIALEENPLPPKVMNAPDQDRALNALYAVPNGVFRMSPDIPGLVETSTSLARVIIRDGVFTTQSLQRSSIESGKTDVISAVRAAFEAVGAEVENSGSYPGRAPNAESDILKVMVGLYEQLFGKNPSVAACHAGLECGIISEHYPGMDMISFGPTIRHPHSPDEKVHVASVGKFWKYLVAALEQIPENS
ncbi:MAG: aminoacyl-histidine dipeptidase [Saprospirales bacterium]|nr:aminoacyl-histidine dipeptidase [Saprospirales bacterium]